MTTFTNEYFSKIKLYMDKFSDFPRLFPVRLSNHEINFLINIISNSKNYLEFGSGGSTFLALLYSNANITSVESDANWIKYLSSWKIIKQNLRQKLKFHHIDIGPTGEWGVPIEPESNIEKFPNYSKSVFEFDNDFDTVFIDGRFRVACVLQTILNCDINTKILMHDFFEREYYHIILNFLELQDSVDTLALFKIKANTNKNDIINMYENYKYIWE